jgi:L-ribulose-5-phosphate 3-epimerase
MTLNSLLPIGIYEKAFPDELGWAERLSMAAKAGYDFIEISIDESELRLARLQWTTAERKSVKKAIEDAGIGIMTMGVSGHRKFPLGSASETLRRQGLDILHRSIDLAADIGIRIIQIMGYDAFYEPSTEDSRARYLEGLLEGTKWASGCGVMLALENVDVATVDSVEKVMRFVKKINSPWFNAYPDIGNMTAAGYQPLVELPLAQGYLVGVHVKDTRPGVLRGVPFGAGIVAFEEAFATLFEMNYSGPIGVEMWAQMDQTGDHLNTSIRAREFVERQIQKAWGYPAEDPGPLPEEKRPEQA